VCIVAHDRVGLERVRLTGGELAYRCAKQISDLGRHPDSKRGSKVDEARSFAKELGLKPVTTSVTSPRSNGLSEGA
jgi:hypothetical protein